MKASALTTAVLITALATVATAMKHPMSMEMVMKGGMLDAPMASAPMGKDMDDADMPPAMHMHEPDMPMIEMKAEPKEEMAMAHPEMHEMMAPEMMAMAPDLEMIAMEPEVMEDDMPSMMKEEAAEGPMTMMSMMEEDMAPMTVPDVEAPMMAPEMEEDAGAPVKMPEKMAAASPMSTAVTGADILNFALNLECLEAEFYSFAAYGHGLSMAQRGGGDGALGARKADLSPEIQSMAEEIAQDEIAHVDFLRAALGDAAEPCPLVDIGAAFKTAANFAAGSILSPRFDPYANDIFFLLGAFIFEDVGVTAYRGAVEPLVSLVEAPTLSAAAGILAVEAYHAGVIRTKLAELVAGGMDTPYGPVAAVAQLISDLRDAVDGDDDLDQGILDGEDVNLVPTDNNAIAYGRSVAQTLAIVLLGNPEKGGFFPAGVTGFFGPKGSAMPDPKMMCPGTCEYKMTVDMSWSPASHPIDFPKDPKGFVFPFWTVAHNKNFNMWCRGCVANAGIQQIAETGAGDIFLKEVVACGGDCGPAVEVPCDPMGGTCSGSATVIVSSTTPYISTGAMLAPSPDWFTGIDMWDLCDDGEWVNTLSRMVPAYDAGTDTAPAFLSADAPNTTPGRIFSYAMVMPPEASIFYNPDTCGPSANLPSLHVQFPTADAFYHY